jgi:hypothetical protein
MKTFEEGLAAVCEVEITNGLNKADMDRVARLQHEFIPDVFSNEILGSMSEQFLLELASQVEHRDGLPVVNQDLLKVIFLNGVLLGTSIGIQMERTELEPPVKRKRKPRAKTE